MTSLHVICGLGPPQSKILAMPMTASEIPTEDTNHDRLFISGLETDSFVFLSSRFIRFTNMSNQIRRICVTAKQPSQQEQNFFLQCFSLFRHSSVSSH